VNDLEDLPNIGENIKEHIKEFLETGTVKEFEDKQGSTEGSG
jgi:DNA polymerase/3'-5' exonuclease PolX